MDIIVTYNKIHYLTYISIIPRGVSSSGSPSLLHTLNSILIILKLLMMSFYISK